MNKYFTIYLTLIIIQLSQAQNNQVSPDSSITQVTKPISEQNELLLPLATEIEKMNAMNPNNKAPVKVPVKIITTSHAAQVDAENERLKKYREMPITIARFQYFAAANYNVGKFHTAIGTISLLASIGSIATIIASASKYENWDINHTTAMIPAGVGLVCAIWQIDVGARLKNASRPGSI